MFSGNDKSKDVPSLDKAGPAGTFAPLRHKEFRRLWLATMVANLGTVTQGVTAGWVMKTLTESADLVALVQAMTTLPIMLFSLCSGALADNYDRRRIMLVAQSMMLAAAAILGVVSYLGLVTPLLVLVLTFMAGSGAALHNPSWQASIGDFVPRPDIQGAVTLNGMSFNLMRSLGPGVGGVVLAIFSATVSFFATALSFVAIIIALARWKPNYPKSKLPREPLPAAILAGLRYVSMSPNILTVQLRACAFGFCAIVVLALMPVIAGDILRGGPLIFGGLLACFGAGGALGAMLNAQLRSRSKNETIVRFGCVVFAASVAGIAFSKSIILSCLLLVPIGACWVALMSLHNAVIQLSTPRWVVGRVMSLYQTAVFGGMAVGSWFWGWFAAGYGIPSALLAASAGLFACVFLGRRFPMPDFTTLDLSPLDQFREPSLRLSLDPRSGPISITVDYVIDRDDVVAFLDAMTKRRKIRLRDGAGGWALKRDLENPELWTESYHVATWFEYIRHNQRRTRADAEVSATLVHLHRLPDGPRVRRMIERQTVSSADDMPWNTVEGTS